MSSFIEIRRQDGQGVFYVRQDSIVLVQEGVWGGTEIVTTAGVYLVAGETLEGFKSRLRMAVSPAPSIQKGEQ